MAIDKTKATPVNKRLFVHPTPTGISDAIDFNLVNVGNTDYSIGALTKVAALTGVLTANRTWFLPPASAVNAGKVITVMDAASGVGTYTLQVSASYGDTLDDFIVPFNLNWALGEVAVLADGVNKWEVITVKPIARDVQYHDNYAIDVLLPDQSGNYGKVLGTDGTHVQWVSGGGGGGGPGVSGQSGYSGFSGSGISGYSGFGSAGASGFSGFSGPTGASTSGFSGFSGPAGGTGGTGTSGYSGFSGSGLSGYSGFSGSGLSGFSGFQGTTGASGFSGFSGPSGTSGYSGFSGSGLSGYSGFSGSGLSGYSGFSGPSGLSGYSGFSGPSGQSGYSGFCGLSGYSGFSGSGISGYSGFSGPAGTSGFSGYSGKSGYSGFCGLSGYSGFCGLSGYSGFSGSGISGYSGFSGVGTSGYSGFSGPSGTSGYSGFCGLSGYSGFSGPMGPGGGQSGYSGFCGLSGYSGFSGPAGGAGTSGFSGFCGLSGYSGFSGPAGTAGTSGFSGFCGLSGYSGFCGLSGYSGFCGLSGYSGFCGLSGYSGFSGSGLSGYSGFSGTGASGFSGFSSLSGYSGFCGLSGYSGFSGSGVSGYSGFSGSGLSGYSGFSGPSGISGYSGFCGLSGYSGFSGSGVSGYSGFSGLTGNTGTSGFSGFCGLSGYSGFSGLTGNQGNTGTSGFSGFCGLSGYSGFSGPAGGTGTTGTSGFSGFCGLSGYSGFSGLTGNTGTSGFSGFCGLSGYSGFSGPAGGTGTSGFSGFCGLSGYSGFSGPSGLSGYSGFSGPSGTSGYSGFSGSGLSGYSGFSGAGATGADPTSTIGLAIIAGSAGTFMRSDGAPPLSQAIAPTWTNQHLFQQALTIASGANKQLDDINIVAATTTVTGSTQITRAKGFNKVSLYRPTLTDASPITIDQSAALYIEHSPLAAGSVTLTNPYALWVDDGVVRLDGGLGVGVTTQVTTGVIEASVGFRQGTMTAGRTLRSDGTNFVSAQLTAGDLSNGTTGLAGTNVVLTSGPTISAPNINKLSNLTTNGLIETTSSDGTLTVSKFRSSGSGGYWTYLNDGDSSFNIENLSSGSGAYASVEMNANGDNAWMVKYSSANNPSGNPLPSDLVIGQGSLGRVAMFNVPGSVASSASLTWDTFAVLGVQQTFTGTTQITTATGINRAAFFKPTYAGSALTIDRGATVWIEDAPAVSGVGMVLTDKYALWVDSGTVRIDAGLTVGGTAAPSTGVINASTGFTIGGAASSGVILRGNGTNYVASAFTLAVPGLAGTFLRSDGTNWAASGIQTSDLGTAVNSDVSFASAQTFTLTNGSTSGGDPILTLKHNSSGTAGTGFGGGIDMFLEDSTTNDQSAAAIYWNWSTATHGSYVSYLDFYVATGGSRANRMRLHGSGGLSVNNTTDPGAGIINANSGFTIGTFGSPAAGKILISDGTKYITSTPTYPNAATASTVVTGDGTNFTANANGRVISAVATASTTSSASLVDLSGMTVALTAGTWLWETVVIGQSSSTAGAQFGVNYSGTTTSIDGMHSGQTTGIAFTATARITAVNTASTICMTTANTECEVYMTGQIVVSNGGNLTTKGLKVTSGTLTYRAGSWLKATRVS